MNFGNDSSKISNNQSYTGYNPNNMTNYMKSNISYNQSYSTNERNYISDRGMNASQDEQISQILFLRKVPERKFSPDRSRNIASQQKYENTREMSGQNERYMFRQNVSYEQPMNYSESRQIMRSANYTKEPSYKVETYIKKEEDEDEQIASGLFLRKCPERKFSPDNLKIRGGQSKNDLDVYA